MGFLIPNLLPGFYQLRNLTARFLLDETALPESLFRRATNERAGQLLRDTETMLRHVLTHVFARVGHDAVQGHLQNMQQPGEVSQFHLHTPMPSESDADVAKAVAREIVAALREIKVVYYRPHGFLPALRIELGAAVAENPHRLATVLRGLKEQSAVASMLEPYPLYMADRMAKSLAAAIPAFRQVATQRISVDYEGDIGEVFFAMHGYRSEGGR